MQIKNWISFGLIACILIASVLILFASTPKKEKITCKKSKDCSGGLKGETPEETTLENLSHQFITLPVSLP